MVNDKHHSPRENSPHGDTDSHHVSNRSSAYFPSDIDKQMPTRSRASSNPNGLNPAPRLDDAINTAVRNTTTNQVDADLVAQITEQVTKNVINAMKASGMGGSPPASESSYTAPYQPTPMGPGLTRSPTNSTTASFPSRYTPPSPSGRHENTSHRSFSPDPPLSESGSMASDHDASRATYRRDSRDSDPAAEDPWTTRPRPARVPTAIHETTVLEKAWQPLFESGLPTARLGQFLRGIAIHLIEDYEPKSSLVVTPAKMVQFFGETKQPDEFYPFSDIFGGKCTNVSISKMYQTLRCQHHLVQRNGNDHGEPSIPGLTPRGFESWMTLLIQAHPDKEFDRLAHAVLNMPISNADQPTERFPKQLSRRLLPEYEDRSSQQKVYSAIPPNIHLRNSNPMPPPPSQPPPINTAFKERERNPYSSTPSGTSFGATFDDDVPQSPRIPIERERQPYTAREGTGKLFEDHERELRDADMANGNRGSRSNSTAPAPPSAYSNSTRPMDVPPPNHQRQHRSSITGGVRPNLGFGTTPPMVSGTKNPYTKSEGANISEIPQEYYASNLGGLRNGSFDDDSVRRYPRRPTTDDDNNRHMPPQMPPLRMQSSANSGYDYNGARDSRDTRESYDDVRRRSLYPGGTDGYGSYPTSRGYQ